MKLRYLSVFFSAVLLLAFSCSNDDDAPADPQIEMAILEKEHQLTMGESITFEALNQNNATYTEKWVLNDSLVSTSGSYEFIPSTSGNYTLTYEALSHDYSYTYVYEIKVAAPIRPITDQSNVYVTQLFEFYPAPGQFINKAPGNLASAEGLQGKKGLVSLGAWGGYVVYGFDHTVLNTPDEADFMVYGNAMHNFSEPGIIYVMQDENGNGLPDDTWYEIKGSAHDLEGSIRNYELTYYRPEDAAGDIAWKDNQGNEGHVLKNNFHKQAYYPEWIETSSYTLKGTLITDQNIDMTNPMMITSAPFEYGYADNTVGGDKINIADAIDAEGNPVQLHGIDFVKIQTGVQANMGWLGELSTEVAGIADLSLLQ